MLLVKDKSAGRPCNLSVESRSTRTFLTDYACSISLVELFGRGFDSRHLHFAQAKEVPRQCAGEGPLCIPCVTMLFDRQSTFRDVALLQSRPNGVIDRLKWLWAGQTVLLVQGVIRLFKRGSA